MPSSSTHESRSEAQLIGIYQLIFLRFWYSGYKKLAHDTTAYFEELLDWGDDALVRTLYGDPKWVKEWEKYIRGKKPSENIWAVAEYLCDAGHCLRIYGRVKAADRFLTWVEGTQRLARDMEDDEKNGYYHHGG